jgi:hypothetical protein
VKVLGNRHKNLNLLHKTINNNISNEENLLKEEKLHLLELVIMYLLNFYKNKNVVMEEIYGHLDVLCISFII